MAIYHFSAKMISRATGASGLAAAAYRSASRLYDERLGRNHDFTNKAGVVHSEILLPEGAPEAWHDRQQLWNDVEAAELRKDAQLAREVEFAIPREMTKEQGIELARDFVTREFVSRGMVADLNIHWDMGADGEAKPHAHVMLSLRKIVPSNEGQEPSFGAKERDWNRTDLLNHWRAAWADHVNERLAALDIEARIDHRSLEAQGINLEPQHKLGPAAARRLAQGLTSERSDEHLEIARTNGDKLLANPALALDAITKTLASFTHRDLAKFIHRHSDGKEQFDALLAKVKAAPELVALGRDGKGEERFTTRAMIETENRLSLASDRLDASRKHGMLERTRVAAIAAAKQRGLILSAEQQSALGHVTNSRGISNVIGYAGSGKSAMLGVAREAWEAAGYQVQGAALSGIAAEGLEHGSGIASRTIASLEHQWAKGEGQLTSKHILVIDEAGMIGTQQMERVVSEVQRRGAKLVLVGDTEQLQAIEAGAAFRSVTERHGAVEILEVRRQAEPWQREATKYLATERTGEALAAYQDKGHVHEAPSRDEARNRLIRTWDEDRLQHPGDSRIILTHTNDEVAALNKAARARMWESQALGQDVRLETERGHRDFAPGDRIIFLKNERSLDVKNGTLGTVEQAGQSGLSVRLDDGRKVAFDIKDYAQVDHGYAATIHKAQGMTVDKVLVLATPGLDRHATYVALSRHRRRVDLHYGQDDFADHAKLRRTLSRERLKDMASDYSIEKQTAPTLKREAFTGLNLRSGPTPAKAAREQSAAQLQKARLHQLRIKAPALGAPKPRDPLDRAVEGYARSLKTVWDMQSKGYEPIPDQRRVYFEARAKLNALVPDADRDLVTAFRKEPAALEEAIKGKTQRAILLMRGEAVIRIETQKRAEQFIKLWSSKLKQMRHFERNYEDFKASKVADELGSMAKALHRDPQLESLLKEHLPQLGLKRQQTQSLSHDLQEWLSPSRSRGLSR